MVAKGNANKHRYQYSAGIKAVEESKHGAEMAQKRYGAIKTPDMKAEDRSEPQRLGDRNNLRGPVNDHRDDWVRGRGEDATKMPNFLPGYRKK